MMCWNWKHKMHLSYLLNYLNIIYNSNVMPCPQETCPILFNETPIPILVINN